MSLLFQCVRLFNRIKKITDTVLLKGTTDRLQSEMENRRKATDILQHSLKFIILFRLHYMFLTRQITEKL